MNSLVKDLNSQFTLDWVVKSTQYVIKYRKAFNVDEIDDIFCNILNSYNGILTLGKFANLLGFNLVDIAEKEIYDIYLNKLKEYNLISIDGENIILSELGNEAITTGLKYKYYHAETVLFDNDSVNEDDIYFSFNNFFNLNNKLINNSGIYNNSINDIELINKLQFQLFQNNVSNGEILEVYQSSNKIDYTKIKLICESTFDNNSIYVKYYYNDIKISPLEDLISNPNNSTVKDEIYHKAMQNYILLNKDLILFEDIIAYKDLWNWNDIDFIKKIDWFDQRILYEFKESADGSTWYILSENLPIEALINNLNEFKDFWYWPVVTRRVNDDIIISLFNTYPWDFEELSYKESTLVINLLVNYYDESQNWDWIYLSENLPDSFIEDNIEKFPWDYFSITKAKNEIFRNTFIKFKDNLELLISKNWDWKFISENINVNFLYKNIDVLASKINWEIVLIRF